MSMSSSSQNKRKNISTITGSGKKKKSTAENKIRCVICSRKVAAAGGAEGTSVVSPFCSLCNPSYLMNNFPLPNYLTNIPNFQLPPYYPQPQMQEPLHFSDDDEPVLVPVPVLESSSTALFAQRVSIKAIPERDAVAAAESASPFAVVIGLKAPPLISQPQRAPLDIVTVLDVSGSMNGVKLDLVKRAMHFVIDNLGDCDRLSIVSFSDHATRMLPLKRMTESGRQDARRAVDLLHAGGGTNILQGLKKGSRVLEERRFKNPVATIIFLSDGNDTYDLMRAKKSLKGIKSLLTPSTFAVHSFGFGSDHDPITMHAISEVSGGTFSFIESYEMVQDAFASCIGGLMSVVTHDLRLKLRSASHGVEIKSIPSGRYKSEVSNEGSQGLINVGDLYADEEKEFLINLSIPISISISKEAKTSLVDITCSYKDAASKQEVVEIELVEIKRPKAPSLKDVEVKIEVDRQRNRLCAAESIQKAQEMAEAGNLREAKKMLAKKRDDLMGSAAGKAGDGLVVWLEDEMKQTEMRMGSAKMYEQSGRAFALAGMSSHASQRATTRGGMVAGNGGYATPQMANMVTKSRQVKKEEGELEANNMMVITKYRQPKKEQITPKNEY